MLLAVSKGKERSRFCSLFFLSWVVAHFLFSSFDLCA